MNELHILHIYPNEMNTYGDRGNTLTLIKRAKHHGLKPILHHYHIGGVMPDKIDIVLGGGGQDAAQNDIQVDIQKIADKLHDLANDGVPMLMVCGTYQLFGHRFVTNDQKEIQGIGVLDIETYGSKDRMIGNVAVETEEFSTMYGFENHSGKTILAEGQAPLGRVVRGHGNNGEDKTEGARTKNVFGTYMHGPVLPNNPLFADTLIRIAAKRNDPDFRLQQLDDSLVDLARANAENRKY